MKQKQNLKILALIPARGGSKRVKNKNIRQLGGKPLIAYTIEAAKNSKYINRVIVSTDSSAIFDVAREHGAEVPFLRPAEIAQDNSTEFEYYNHILSWLRENEDYSPDLIVNLYPTSPFRKTETIDLAIEKILSHPEADSLRSVKKCTEHPYKMWRIIGEWLEPLVSSSNNNIHTLSYHLLPETYIQNASIYITKTRSFYQHNSTVGSNILSFVMTDDESIDINSELDFLMAETLLNKELK